MNEQPMPTERIFDEGAPRQGPVALVPGRELVAVLGLVILADMTIYRAQGFAGPAALFALAPLLLLWGAPERRVGADSWIVGTMLLVVAAAMAWCGGVGQLALGAMLLVAFGMTAAGMRAYVVDVLLFAFLTIVTGGAGLTRQLGSLNRVRPLVPRATWLKVVLPLAAVLGFGTLFVRANPDEAKSIADWLARVWSYASEMLENFTPSVSECLFWFAAAWITGGLLRPLMRISVFTATPATAAEEQPQSAPASNAPLYAAFRNTLIAVIALFAAYLVFEFTTMWGRVFPKGFYYSGYAHEGAAWLTAALALATLVLSAIFRTSLSGDSRLPRLRRLAWVWSAENALLAVAVYHRMNIYIGFNGMTRMRTVGLLGITAVLVGFMLVVWKITRGRSFVWLLNRQLWTLFAALYVYAVLPVDWLVHTYNVRRILAGDPAPSVQISVHPIDSAGALALHPLINCDNPTIREGIRALLAERARQVEEREHERSLQNWTSFQLADELLVEQLRGLESNWAEFTDATRRRAALERFHEYAYQWY